MKVSLMLIDNTDDNQIAVTIAMVKIQWVMTSLEEIPPVLYNSVGYCLG